MTFSNWDTQHPQLWPGESQRLLLRAMLLRGDEARAAWREWVAAHDLADVCVEDSALLPPLCLAAERLGVEASDRKTLLDSYRANWLKNQFAIAHLRRMLASFRVAQVPTLVLKGIALVLFYYGDEGARRMADVDLLIPAEALSRAARVLDSLGWGSQSGVPPPELLPYHHAMHWQHPSGFHLDLHWRAWTTDAPPQAEDALWRRSEIRETPFGEMRIPGPCDLLILMCYHGRKQDRLARGRWVLDVATILDVRGAEIDGSDLMARAAQCGLAAPVGDALEYVRREYGITVPGLVAANWPKVDAGGSGMRYRELARHALTDRGLGETVVSGWWRYAAVQRARGESPRWTGFIAHYLADRQWQWGLERRSQVPGRALRKALRRLRSHGV